MGELVLPGIQYIDARVRKGQGYRGDVFFWRPIAPEPKPINMYSVLKVAYIFSIYMSRQGCLDICLDRGVSNHPPSTASPLHGKNKGYQEDDWGYPVSMLPTIKARPFLTLYRV